jgi:phytoene synthase
VYAFCRTADDLVDVQVATAETIAHLKDRVTQIYADDELGDPIDRALSAVVRYRGIPRTVFDALVEGFAWEVDERQYDSLSDVYAYSARVAATVGVAVTYVMTQPGPHALARACDMGIAMQLTNIARDVGEDASRGRVYLPHAWLREGGIDPAALRSRPRFTPALGEVVRRLLGKAAALYARAWHGIRFLPWSCRPSIRAAQAIYADIGRVIAAADFDSVGRRAYTSGRRKLLLGFRATMPHRRSRLADLEAPPLPEAAFLVDAGATPARIQ